MQRQPESTRDALVEAAIQVFAANAAATLSDIAAAAGVKRVTLHRLLGSRDELLQTIALRSLKEMDEACSLASKGATSAIEALRACVEALVPVGDRCHFLWTQAEVWAEPEIAKELARQNAELSQLIDDAKSEGSLDPGIPNAWIMAAIEAIVFAALSTAQTGDIPIRDAGSLAAGTLFAGLEKQPVRKPRRKKSEK